MIKYKISRSRCLKKSSSSKKQKKRVKILCHKFFVPIFAIISTYQNYQIRRLRTTLDKSRIIQLSGTIRLSDDRTSFLIPLRRSDDAIFSDIFSMIPVQFAPLIRLQSGRNILSNLAPLDWIWIQYCMFLLQPIREEFKVALGPTKYVFISGLPL